MWFKMRLLKQFKDEIQTELERPENYKNIKSPGNCYDNKYF